jgi:hypothetical protein
VITSEASNILPENCVFAFCLPLNSAAFRSTAINAESYAHQYGGGWAQYNALFVRDAQSSLKAYELLGVEVRTEVTCSVFRDLLLTKRWKIVLLFSHWHDGNVEFADRFWNYDELTDRVPSDSNCILDLCVCHPTELVRKLAAERKNLRLCWTDRRRTPFIWFSFYDSMFRLLSKGSYSYFEAFRTTATAYVEVFGGITADHLEVECQED